MKKREIILQAFYLKAQCLSRQTSERYNIPLDLTDMAFMGALEQAAEKFDAYRYDGDNNLQAYVTRALKLIGRKAAIRSAQKIQRFNYDSEELDRFGKNTHPSGTHFDFDILKKTLQNATEGITREERAALCLSINGCIVPEELQSEVSALQTKTRQRRWQIFNQARTKLRENPSLGVIYREWSISSGYRDEYVHEPNSAEL